MVNAYSVLVLATSVAVAASAGLRASEPEGEGPIEGYPTVGVPILPEHLDFADGVVTSDFVFDVTARTPNQGGGGTVQARESPNTPALQGQGIALSLFTVEEGGQNLIHYHPRATELLYVIKGTIEVAFTDTRGVLHANIVKAGQATVFPRALLHFQRNVGKGTTQYISMLNDENPGVMSFPRVFATLPADILAQALRQPKEKIEELQRTVLPPTLLEGNTDYDGAAGPNGNAPVPAIKKPGYMPPGKYIPDGKEDKDALYKILQKYLKEKKTW